MGGRLLLVVAIVAARERPSVAARSVAHVRYVSARRAYLNAGRVEGLVVGRDLPLSRNGRAIGLCRIDQVGDWEATCLTQVARIGDSFPLPVSAPLSTLAEPPYLPLPPSQEELSLASRALHDTPIDKVEFHGSARSATIGAQLLMGSYGHNSFVTFDGADYEQERLELSLNGIGLRFGGFRAFAHLTAIISSARPSSQRFRPGDVAQIYLWEAAFSSREVGRPYAIALGRIWPYHTPGLVSLDGVQAAWRTRGGDAEVGVYGGLIPDPMTLYPSDNRFATGAYFGYTFVPQRHRALKILQTEGRLGVRGASARPGVQLELEWALMAAISRYFDFGAQARASIGGTGWNAPAFDSGRVHATLRPMQTLRIVASFRYLNPQDDYDAFAAGTLDNRRTYNASLDATWDPRPWIAISLVSGAASAQGATTDTRGWVGPELGFPRLFAGRGGVAVGYREEFGWFAGRNLYLQLTGAGGSRFRALGRIDYFEDRPAGGGTDNPFRELGFYAFIEGRILRWLSARLTAMARVGIDYSGENASPPAGMVLRASFTGTL